MSNSDNNVDAIFGGLVLFGGIQPKKKQSKLEEESGDFSMDVDVRDRKEVELEDEYDDERIVVCYPRWTPQTYQKSAVSSSEYGLIENSQLNGAKYTNSNLERCKMDGATFQSLGAADTSRNVFHDLFDRFSQAVCTIGEKDPDGKFYSLGCATFLSNTVLLTTWHVVCSIVDKKRIAVRIDSDFSIRDDVATCCRYIVNIGVADARSLVDRDIAILFLDHGAQLAIGGLIKEYPKLTMSRLSDFVMIMHTHKGTEHTVVDIGETQTTGCCEQIATQIFADGTFGTCGAGAVNENGCVVGIYVGAENNCIYTKGIMTINDIIGGEIEEYGGSILFDFLQTKEIFSNFYDWINPKNRSYVPEGTEFQKVRVNLSEELSVLECLGKGGKHSHVKKFSKDICIESDHFPPYDAYCSMNSAKYFRKGTYRMREGELPAISIPYQFHRNFITTGSSKATKIFTTEQANLMKNPATFKNAIKMNIVQYQRDGLFDTKIIEKMFSEKKYEMTNAKAKILSDKFKSGIKDALIQHVTLKFLSEQDRLELSTFVDNI